MDIIKLNNLAFSENARDLPIILCFHGAGTNGMIFEIQARSIIQSLKTKFNFLFLNAPFSSLPGPGITTFFSDLKPYFRWHCDLLSTERFNVGIDEIESERMTVRTMLLNELEKHGNQNIVGVMAFSQGTRVATAFCLDEELGKDIKFCIIIAGTFPILPLSRHSKEGHGAVSPRVDQGPLSPVSRLQIPSLHVRGLRDPWLPEGKRLLRTYYNEDQALTVEFNGGHQVPVANKDVEQIQKGVMKFWEQIRQSKHQE